MPKSIVLMSAILPTQGHRDLVNFAYMYSGEVQVIVSSRSHEPVKGTTRVLAFMHQASRDWGDHHKINVVHHADDGAPQYPEGEDDVEFWDYWKSVVLEKMAVASDDVVVASEKYGVKLAEVLGCKFVPYDIDREIRPITGTEVRSHVYDNWEYVMPEYRFAIKKIVTIFGAESCGKTTMARALPDAVGVRAVTLPEWARQYLEAVGPDLTDEKMETIWRGQQVIETAAIMSPDHCLTVRDTDLLSTIGYYRITGREVPIELVEAFIESRAHLYLLMSDGIPFTPDPLRYGGDRRESDMSFWEELLKEFECNYVVIEAAAPEDQLDEAVYHVEELLFETWRPIATFRREIPPEDADEEDVDIEAKFG